MFQVTTLDLDRIPRKSGEAVDYNKDFFGKAGLPHRLRPAQRRDLLPRPSPGSTPSAHLPRREFQHARRHLSEFWMIEPEVAFAELSDNMELAEDFLKHLVSGPPSGLRRRTCLLRRAHPEGPA